MRCGKAFSWMVGGEMNGDRAGDGSRGSGDGRRHIIGTIITTINSPRVAQ